MFNDNNKLIKIVSLLLQRTKSEEVKWSATSSADSYISSLKNGYLEIQKLGESRFRVTISNSGGEIIESSTMDGSDWSDLTLYNLCLDLYYIVRSQVLGIDKTLDGLIEELS